MSVCVECGKQLGVFGGYRHPTLGKKNLVCSLCFETVQHSVTEWSEFVLSHSFNNHHLTGPSRSKSTIQEELTFTHLKYHHNEPLVPVERRAVYD